MSLWPFLILGATLFVAYANGANDNFKGVATLFGSGTTHYHKALAWGTATTMAGSVTAFFLAERLVKTFSGKGLIPDSVIANPVFLTSVILGAGLTVFVTAILGIPISTTHSLTGALAGSGWIALEGNFGYSSLGKNFFVPMISSPFIAVAVTSIVYPIFQKGRQRLGINKETCVCVGEKVIPVGSVVSGDAQAVAMSTMRSFDIFVDQKERCEAKTIELYSGKVLGIQAQKILDLLHFLSAGAVSFARGLNDTPKIVALSVTAGALGLGLEWNIVLVALVMAVGGLVSGRKIAQTMSHRITPMNHGQGFSANLVTAFLVIFASRFGFPVSTTHVSCGSLFGIGLINGKARWKTIGGICSAWVLTLPVAAMISGVCYWVFANF